MFISFIFTNINYLSFYSRSYRNRSTNLRHTRTHMARLERRTALSLRPISLKSYADQSPGRYNSDDSDKLGMRRSTRNRKLQYDNMSWLGDDQIKKVGYPNIENPEFSEEDSRDAQDQIGTRRNPREIKKNQKYLYDYETDPLITRRKQIRNEENEDQDKNKRDVKPASRRNSNDKENKEDAIKCNRRVNTPKEDKSVTQEESNVADDVRTRMRKRIVTIKKDQSDEDDENDVTKGIDFETLNAKAIISLLFKGEEESSKDSKHTKGIKENKANEEGSSESDEEEMPRLRARPREQMMTTRYPRKVTRNRKASGLLLFNFYCEILFKLTFLNMIMITNFIYQRAQVHLK